MLRHTHLLEQLELPRLEDSEEDSSLHETFMDWAERSATKFRSRSEQRPAGRIWTWLKTCADPHPCGLDHPLRRHYEVSSRGIKAIGFPNLRFLRPARSLARPAPWVAAVRSSRSGCSSHQSQASPTASSKRNGV